MKILMVLDREFPPDIRVEKEIDSLINAGHEVHLACLTRLIRKKFEKNNKLIIHRKTINNLTYKSSVACLKFPIYFNFWRKYLTRIFMEYSFDAIHLHDLPLSKVAKEFSMKYQIPFVLDLHENWPAHLEEAVHSNTVLGKILSSNRQWKNYERKYASQADKVITVVEEMKERISQPELIAENVYVLSNTIDIENNPFESTTIVNKRPTLFYAGGINIHRGLQIVLQALIEVKKEIPNILFNIVGSGSYEKVLKNYVKEQSLEENVIFWGWKSYSDMMEILKVSNIALIPHLRSEQTDCSSPNKIFQYAYMKKPIICSDCMSVKRVLLDMQAGFVYKDKDYLQLSREIIKLSKNKDFRIELGESGHKAVLTKYNWQKDAEILVSIYKELEAV